MKIRVKPRLHYLEGREMFDRPDGIIDCAEEIDGSLRSWKEYVPSGYDGQKKVPLVLTLHGGRSGKGQNNHRAELTTAWAAVAEREGFIVVYPQSLTPEHAWAAWEDFSDSTRTAGLKDDLRYLDLLLEIIKRKYMIDETRIYLHGQSFGDVMGSYYLLNRPDNAFAAAALLSGPVGATRYFRQDGSCVFGPECAIPMVRTHGSLDLSMPMGDYQRLEDEAPTYNYLDELRRRKVAQEAIQKEKLILQQIPSMELWKNCNSCFSLPELSIRGCYNSITFHGTEDFHFYMVENGDHGPFMNMADFIWCYFFTGYRYVDGRRRKVEPELRFEADRKAVVIADGASRAYVDNQLLMLDGKASFQEDTFYVPVSCVPQLYPQLQVVLEDEGASAWITDGSRELQVSACNRTMVWCGHLHHGDRTLLTGGTLLVSLPQIGGLFYGQEAKCRYGICYLSEYGGAVTYDFAFLVRQLLGTEAMISVRELWERENQILQEAGR